MLKKQSSKILSESLGGLIRGGYSMKISKKDALMWFEFFAMLPEDEVT